MGRRVVNLSPRGKIGIMASRSSTELFPELSSPIMTSSGGFHPVSDATNTFRTESSCAYTSRSLVML
eukprot:519670-Rhodomonas_salina.1